MSNSMLEYVSDRLIVLPDFSCKIDSFRKLEASSTPVIGLEDAEEELQTFAEETTADIDFLKALSCFLFYSIKNPSKPKLCVDYSIDTLDNWMFKFTIDDYIRVLAKKVPKSRPKNDTRAKVYVPEYKEVHAVYSFSCYGSPDGCQLGYKLYPQKTVFGFRYNRKYRSFESLIDTLICYIPKYLQEDKDIVQTGYVGLSSEEDEDALGPED